MKVFALAELTKEAIDKHFSKHGAMLIQTKTGTKYYILKAGDEFVCESYHCHNPRKMTKEMQTVFC